MNIFERIIDRIDTFQRSHKPTAFGFAVIKKYGDDQAGYQAALVTYYGFLSLFPILLILTTVAGIVSSRDPALGANLVDSVTELFPVIGQSLEESIRPRGTSIAALVVGFVLSLYGARGVADAFRHAVNHIWHVPLAKRAGFPRNILRSVALIFGGGGGLLAASLISGWASAVGYGPVFRSLSIILNIAILYGVFLLIFRLSLPLSFPRSRFTLSAAICAIGLGIMQVIGTYVLTNITPSSYSALFATTLGLLAWIYLQAQILMYAVVINSVRDGNLVPRSLSGNNLTPADEKINKRRSI